MKEKIKIQIKKARTEKNLIEIAIRTLMESTPSDFENIKTAYEIYNEKVKEIEQLESQLEKELSGEAEKRECAKKLLGIGG